jgi:hypothetical protein
MKLINNMSQTLSFKHKTGLLITLFLLSVTALLFTAPIPQDPSYHKFADTRSYLGLSNFGDTASNLGFTLVGCLGLWSVFGPRRDLIFDEKSDSWSFATFFTGVGLVSLGSAYYHLAPDNDRLFWDRLPMTVAFMALFYAILEDRIDGVSHRFCFLPLGLLPVMVALGVASLLYWDWTESQGRGDLRFYGLVQFFPMIALPVICWLFPKARYTGGGYIIWIIVWYGLAKVLEYFDAQIFDMLGRLVSGHSLKHLASAMAAFMVWRMMTKDRSGT